MVENFYNVKVRKIIDENKDVKTIIFDKEIKAKPGQFVMVGITGINEKPFALSYKNGITVKRVGEFTALLHKLGVNSNITIRGPFGNYFTIKNVKNPCVIGGGTGIASIKTLVEKLKKEKIKSTCIIGARNKEGLFFEKILKKDSNLFICTEDRSKGYKGNIIALLKEILTKNRFDKIYGCGPFGMLKEVFNIAEYYKIKCELSLENIIKCGIGICGQCALDEFLVCKDGPIFNEKKLRKIMK